MKKVYLLMMSLFTVTFINSQVLQEGFDGGAIPAGWTQEYVSATEDWGAVTANGNSTITPRTGSHMAEFRTSNRGDATKLITLQLDITTLTTPQLSFYYANVAWGSDIDELRVYYKNSAGGAWTQIGIDYTIEQTSWTEVALSLPNPSNDYYIAFEGTSDWGRGVNIDDVLVDEAPSCIAPSALTVSNLTSTSADLGWTDNTGGSASLWDIEIGGVGFTPTGTPTNTGVTNPFNITTLTPNTPYDFYVRADCGGGDQSDWVGPFSFTTPCNSFSIPWTDSFESNTGAGENSVEPDCWTWENSEWVIGEDGVTANTYNRAPRTGSKFVYINWSSLDWMYTPGLDLTAGVDYTFTFYVVADGSTGFDMEVGVNNAPNSTGMTSLGTETDVTNTTYQLRTYTYTPATTDTYYFGVQVDANGVPWYISFDDFNVIETPTCLPPTALAVGNVTGISAELDWTDNSGSGLFDIELGAAGFTPTGTPTESGITTTPHPVTGLTPSTPYEYYVRADCGGGDFSPWVGPFAFTTGQIPVSVFPYTQDWEAGQGNWDLSNGTETNQWHVGTATNNGGSNGLYISDDGGTSHNYNTSNTSVVHAFRDFQIGAGNSFIELSFDWLADGENCCDRMRVYLAPTSFTPTTGTEITASGTAPTGIIQLGGDNNDQLTYITETYLLDPAYAGQSFRLIFQWRNDFSVGTQPPAAIDNIIVNVASCGPPSNLSVSNITTDGADIDWDAFATEPSWNVQFDTTGFAIGTGTTWNVSVASDTTLDNLAQYTEYDVYVQAECGTNDTSTWVGPITFTTDPVCPNPTGLNATYITQDTVVLDWTNGGTETMWNVEWGITGFTQGMGTTIAFDTKPDTLLGTPAGSVLDVYIQADCGGGTTNPWFGPIQVATPIENDSTCDAVDLMLDTIYTYSNVGSTTQIGETRGMTAATAYNTVWFTFTAPASGAVAFDLDNTDFDTYSTLYEVVDCDDFATFTPVLGSDPETFEVCTLTPGTIYYLQVGSYFSTSEGIIEISINDLAIDAGTVTSADICAGDTLDLNTTLSGAEMGGMWTETSPMLGNVNGSDYESSQFQAAGMYQVEYRVSNVCLYDSILVDVNVAGTPNAGMDGSIAQECNFGTVNLFDGLTGTVDLGGTWLDANNDTIMGASVDFNGEAAGSYVYTYVASNGICADDSATTTIDLIDCTSLEEDDNGSVTIYPNPTTGVIFIANNSIENEMIVEVSDINGKVMSVNQIYLSQGQTFELDLNTAVKGIYFVKIKTETNVNQHKVIVQ